MYLSVACPYKCVCSAAAIERQLLKKNFIWHRKRSCQKSCQSLFSDHSSKTNTYFLCSFDIKTSFPCLLNFSKWPKLVGTPGLKQKRIKDVVWIACKIENGSKFVSREESKKIFWFVSFNWVEMRRCRSITFTIARCHPIDELHWIIISSDLKKQRIFQTLLFGHFWHILPYWPKKDLALSSSRMRWHIWQRVLNVLLCLPDAHNCDESISLRKLCNQEILD